MARRRLKTALSTLLATTSPAPHAPVTLPLVGRGPGDRIAGRLKGPPRGWMRPHVVIYDRLISPEILTGPPEALIDDVGQEGFGPPARRKHQ